MDSRDPNYLLPATTYTPPSRETSVERQQREHEQQKRVEEARRKTLKPVYDVLGEDLVLKELTDGVRNMLRKGQQPASIASVMGEDINTLGPVWERAGLKPHEGEEKKPGPKSHYPPSSSSASGKGKADAKQGHARDEKEDARSFDWEAYFKHFTDKGIPIPRLSPTELPRLPSPGPEAPTPLMLLKGATYVRTVTDSEKGTEPVFEKGDIFRVICKRRKEKLYYEVMSLKPPGEMLHLLESVLEAADQEAVDQVGREAVTKEEKDAFRRAVDLFH